MATATATKLIKSIDEKIKTYVKQGIISGRKTVATNISYDFERRVFYVLFNYGIIDGKPYKPKRTFQTTKEAVEALEDFEYEKQKKQLIAPQAMTFGEYCDYWFTEHCSQVESTRRFYGNIINKYIKKHAIANIGIQQITKTDINTYVDSLIKKGKLSNSTIKKHRATLITILGRAEYDEIIYSNPANKSKMIKVRKPQIKSYDLEETQKILELAKLEEKPYGYIYQLAIYTGMRRGELLGLKWSNVNFKEQTIFILETRTDTTHGMETKENKSEESERIVELIPDAIELLQTIKIEQDDNRRLFGDAYQESDFVLTYADGSVCFANVVSKRFMWFLNKHGIRRLPFKDLRHTYGTFQRIIGASAYDIKELMGHSSVKVAEQNYIKKYAKKMKPHMNRFQDYLNGDLEGDDDEGNM